MSEPTGLPAEMIELQRSERNLSVHDTVTLLQTPEFQLIQIRMPAGSGIPNYEAHGQVILQCLEGDISVHVQAQPHRLTPHQLLFLNVNEPFSISAAEDSSILATIVSPTSGREVDIIGD